MKKILVFGSFVVDLTSRADRLPQPGETVLGSSFKLGPGGKGSNQAVAAHRAGADSILATKVGRDVFGQVALDFYAAEGMPVDLIMRDDEVPTGTALIMVNEREGQNMILVVIGACGNINDEDIRRAEAQIRGADILMLQLEINQDALEKIIDIAHQAGTRVVLNPAPARHLPPALLAKVDTLTPNETEAALLSGVPIKSFDDAKKAARVLLDMGVRNLVITMGSMGAYVTDGTREEVIPSIKVEAIDTTGAGDAFNGGFITALSEGMDLFDAARFGNATGALSVTKLGTAPAMPHRADIVAMCAREYPDLIIKTRKE
ncbi:MAG: ribokinase [Clostridiales bacterium]|nr:ribokinase [Clostridiales bacterium]